MTSSDKTEFDVSIINEMIGEMKTIDNKDQFYLECALDRMRRCNLSYMKSLDKQIDTCIRSLTEDLSFKKIRRHLKILSRSSIALSDGLVTAIHKLYSINRE